jgi:hypothetical protein
VCACVCIRSLVLRLCDPTRTHLPSVQVKSDPPVLQRRENTIAGPPAAASLDALKARLARMQRNADA